VMLRHSVATWSRRACSSGRCRRTCYGVNGRGRRDLSKKNISTVDSQWGRCKATMETAFGGTVHNSVSVVKGTIVLGQRCS
jgi:hypothetical protein